MGHNGGPDWRAMMAGEDADAIKALSRFQKPTDLLKSYQEAQKALSKRAEPMRLTDQSTPEQVAEFRKAAGVPDISKDASVDDVIKAYGISPPQGYEMNETNKGLVGDFVKEMNAAHLPPDVVKKATDFYFKQDAAIQQAVRKDNTDKMKSWQNELRDELGAGEYDGQQAAAKRWMTEQFGDDADAMQNILQAQLPGGGRLGDHPWFFKLIASQAMGAGYTDRIEANALESSGKTLADQQKEIEDLRRTDRSKYDSPQTQQRLDRIISLRHQRGEIDDYGNVVSRR